MNKSLFYLLNFTWGIIMNILGAVAAAALTFAGIKPTHHAGSIVYRIGHYWGGLNLGIFSFVSQEAGKHTLDHEFGHALQNAVYGPLHPFIVAIPSAIRYWKFRHNENKGIKNPQYDDIWFEGQATDWGTKMSSKW